MITITNILRRARNYIKKPCNFKQGSFYNGCKITESTSFCAHGARMRACIDFKVRTTSSLVDRLYHYAKKLYGTTNLVVINDGAVGGPTYGWGKYRCHEAILRIYDAAIANKDRV